ncbi:DGQHR domain-containing protein [Leptospira selangorensis]|uniref:DGQHR domain-containing protein n=1 Tax=Leptospira selangorensis TaxID=2484982 RepID=UPI0010845D0B|nr:DGQHR domain-containing protein [Leptospira selangorensis]TGK04432.1 DGQHR domain-containing protein [Leptospira selangorensis]
MSSPIIELEVLKVHQPIGDFFITSIKAADLVKISYADVRRLAEEERDIEKYLGIQRPISKKRIKDIKSYIRSKDATFPTSVIVAIDEKCAEFEEQTANRGLLRLKPYTPDSDTSEDAISLNKIAKVIDGQHRIAAFLNEDNQYSLDFQDLDFDINLSIFIGADVSEQANIFATVNLAQTKVNRSLVYDLTELAKTRSPHKTCHNVAVVLDLDERSPLFHRIKRLGTATPGRKYEPLTQASFVESLVKFISLDPAKDRNDLLRRKKLSLVTTEDLKKVPFRNLFIENKELDIAEILFNYFSAIKSTWPNSWDSISKSGNLLPKSNAFKAFMIYLREDVYPKEVKDKFGMIPSSKSFKKHFNHIELTDDDFTIRNFAPGSGGQSTFLKMLRGEIALKDMLE